MKTITRKEAIERLEAVKTKEELRALIQTLDVKGSGRVTLLWSGSPGTGIDQAIFASSLASSQRDIRAIQSTEAAKFLQVEDRNHPNYNQKLVDKLDELFAGGEETYFDFLYGATTGTGDEKRRIGKGIWDDVSELFVKQAQGDVRLVVGGAKPDRVFAQTEIFALLNNPNIRSIEGVPIDGLRDLAKSSGVNQVLKLLTGLSEANTGMIQLQVDGAGRPIQAPDGSYRLNASDYLKMHASEQGGPRGMRSVMEFIPEERRLRHQQAVEEIFKLHPILRVRNYALPLDPDPFKAHLAAARVSTYMGRVADVVGMTTMISQAGQQLYQGDHRGAHNTITSWVAENAGAFAAGRIATLLVAPLMATGPVGMLIGAGIIIGASVAGGDLFKRLHTLLLTRFRELERLGSPLILDLNGNGVETLSLERTAIYFDLDVNGFAEKTGWVGPNDGLLVLDLNQNGRIDSGAELFGNYTPLANGKRAKHGFEALARYDVNRDGRIDSKDPIWTRLRVWRDQNSNAITDSGELLRLEATNTRSLLLRFQSSNDKDLNGNEHREKGSYLKTNGSLGALTDVWFVRDTFNSRQLQLRSVDDRTALLPNLRGMGLVPSLHQALMAPGSSRLRELLTQWSKAPRQQRGALRDDLLLEWCDAKSSPFNTKERQFVANDPAIREKVAVVEKIMGQVVPGTEEVMGPIITEGMLELFGEVGRWMDMMLTAQVDALPLLKMNPATAFDHLRTRFLRERDPGLVPMIQWHLAHSGVNGLTFFETLRQRAEGRTDAFAQAMNQHRMVAFAGEWLPGSEEEDGLIGSALDDFIEGGNNRDELQGLAGNDILIGGHGNDVYLGGSGADTYYLSHHQSAIDRIFDESSPDGLGDRVIFTEVSSRDMRLQKQETNVGFYMGNKLIVYIEKQLVAEHRIEEFHFTDGVIWDHNTILLQLPLVGTPGDDRLIGAHDSSSRFQGLNGNDMLIGGALADHLEGGNGHDLLRGLAGRDILDGGEGNDILEGGEGGDRYVFAMNGGHDRLLDSDQRTNENDRVELINLKPSHLTRVQRIGQDLRLDFGSTTSLTLVNQLQPFARIEEFQFAEGPTWGHATLLERVS